MMADFIFILIFILLFGSLVVISFKECKRAEVEHKAFREMQRHFMAAGLAYFSVMNRYVTSITPDEHLSQCPCDDE